MQSPQPTQGPTRKRVSARKALMRVLLNAATVRPLTADELQLFKPPIKSPKRRRRKEALDADQTRDRSRLTDATDPDQEGTHTAREATPAATNSPGRSIGSLLTEFERHVHAESTSEKQRYQVLLNVRTVVAGVGITSTADFDHELALKIKEWHKTATYKTTARRPREKFYSSCTKNKHLAHFKQFCKWLGKRCQIIDPSDDLTAHNAKADRRIKRRHLTEQEERALLDAAKQGNTIDKRSGTERHLLYSIALRTGFRKKEISALTPANILHGLTPEIFLPGSKTKNGEDAHQPITVQLCDQILAYCKARSIDKNAPIFPRLEQAKTERYVRHDCTMAGIEAENVLGRIDFHALRHTFNQRLYEHEVDIKTRQDLCRHKTLEINANTYTRSEQTKMRAAVNQLSAG